MHVSSHVEDGMQLMTASSCHMLWLCSDVRLQLSCLVIMTRALHGMCDCGGAMCCVLIAFDHVSPFVLVSDIDFEFNLLSRLKILGALVQNHLRDVFD